MTLATGTGTNRLYELEKRTRASEMISDKKDRIDSVFGVL